MVIRHMVVDAVVLEGRSVREVAKSFGVSKTFVAKLVKRFRAGGYEALAPLSRAHHFDPNKTGADVEDRIIRLRKQLGDYGVDDGADTIHTHLRNEIGSAPSIRTVHRVLVRRGFVTPEPKKRPRSSFVRFEADQPNERWQADSTHWNLRDGRDVEVLSFIDDHSRLLLSSVARPTIKGSDVVSSFLLNCEQWGTPAKVLTDNGAIFNAISRKGKTNFESLLEDLGVIYQHSRPYHPQTQGKIERWHRTLKKWLDKRPLATSIPQLQNQLDEFCEYYNTKRPHRAVARRTPAVAYAARDKALPGAPAAKPHYRIRHDTVDSGGKVSIRHRGKMLHINVGYRHRGKRVILHVIDTHVRVLSEEFKLLGESTLDPTQSYQPMQQAD
jgi:transposase InsO family protein